MYWRCEPAARGELGRQWRHPADGRRWRKPAHSDRALKGVPAVVHRRSEARHDDPMPFVMSELAEAAPLTVATAYGLGPLGGDRKGSPSSIAKYASSLEGMYLAVESAGRLGMRFLSLLATHGGAIGPDVLGRETATAVPGMIDQVVARLVASGLVEVRRDGGVALRPTLNEMMASVATSMADPNVITSDQLGRICSKLGIKSGTKKADRIAAIAAVHSDPVAREGVRATLSPDAVQLLDHIADVAGLNTVHASSVGLPGYLLSYADAPRFSYGRPRTEPAEVAALAELTTRGIVGVASWGEELWIWKESWPFLDRPLYTDWTMVARPPVCEVDTTGPPAPPIVGVIDQLLRAWETEPPPAMKSSEPRLAKTVIRAASKAIGCDVAAADLGAQLAIGIGLVMRTEVGRSGRGRNTKIDAAWVVDEAMVTTWRTLAPLARWARTVGEWCRPSGIHGDQLLCNRHLVLWELSQLDPGWGFEDDGGFAAWIGDRYAGLGVAEAAEECLADLRRLGVVTESGVGLTGLGRDVLTDPAGVATRAIGESVTAAVQADLTVIAPPDLRHDLAGDLDTIAALESASGALTYRLDPTRITRAIQAGDTADAIIERLGALATGQLPDTVVRLVRDAASRAGTVQVITAPTVVVVADPADLATACALKSLKLTRISDTIAITEVPAAKVRAALDKKGFTPEAVTATEAPVRSATSEAERLRAQAKSYRAVADRRPDNPYMSRHASIMEAQAAAMDDTDGRLAVKGPIALTPELVGRSTDTGASKSTKRKRR